MYLSVTQQLYKINYAFVDRSPRERVIETHVKDFTVSDKNQSLGQLFIQEKL